MTAAAVVLAAAVGLAGCTSQDPLSQQYREGGNEGFVAGDGTTTELAPDQREEPVALEGPTADGGQVTLADYRGDVVVLNVWYASCAPCRAEAPDLADISREYAGQDVRFLGINTRDDAAQAQAFERTFSLDYPSVLDAGTGSALLALRGQANPQAVPTTLVLDRGGRVAARVVGRAEGSVLRAMLDRVVEEQ
jgi:thiol-disulfide isomerase/thioredoxin